MYGWEPAMMTLACGVIEFDILQETREKDMEEGERRKVKVSRADDISSR